MALLHHPHDRFFKGLLDQPGTVLALLRERLPPEISALLSEDPPELEDGEYVDEALKGSQSDRLYRAQLKAGGEVLLYVLLDHRSRPNHGVILELLGYMINIWRRRAAGQAASLKALPPILPLVIYHGEEPWTVSLSLRDTIDAPEIIKQFQPEFFYRLMDLGPIADPALSGFPPLRAGLLVLKYAQREGDHEAILFRAFTDARENYSLLRILTVYVTAVYRRLTLSAFERVLRNLRAEWGKAMVSIVAQEWMAEGRVEGRAEGRTEGRSALLIRQLRHRYGDLPDGVLNAIAAADSDQLDEWGERLLDARSLQEVFGPNGKV